MGRMPTAGSAAAVAVRFFESATSVLDAISVCPAAAVGSTVTALAVEALAEEDGTATTAATSRALEGIDDKAEVEEEEETEETEFESTGLGVHNAAELLPRLAQASELDGSATKA